MDKVILPLTIQDGEGGEIFVAVDSNYLTALAQRLVEVAKRERVGTHAEIQGAQVYDPTIGVEIEDPEKEEVFEEMLERAREDGAAHLDLDEFPDNLDLAGLRLLYYPDLDLIEVQARSESALPLVASASYRRKRFFDLVRLWVV